MDYKGIDLLDCGVGYTSSHVHRPGRLEENVTAGLKPRAQAEAAVRRSREMSSFLWEKLHPIHFNPPYLEPTAWGP